MLKDTDGYPFTGSINWKYTCKVRSFSGAKTTDMDDYVKPTTDILILVSPQCTLGVQQPNLYSKTKTMLFPVQFQEETYSDKAMQLREILKENCMNRNISLINHDNINKKASK